ncbi:MAG: type VI secretion system baseplate subunit TssF [Treponema sp.]|jgi:type VI secretion system VasI/ImpG family protein|nr:type VI secretion system baseplate subunit TssF [Treponema sp.]
MDLLDYYRDNLLYIRGLAAEFAAEFPKIAGRLNLSDFECQDPYIERLLEGTAFLSAKIEKKLDEGYYCFLESVLNSLAPNALYPVPAGGVLELILNSGNERIRQGMILEAGTFFDASIPTINTPCRFSSVTAVPLTGFSLTEAEYVTRDMSVFGIANSEAVSALHLALTAGSGDFSNSLDEILFFINLPQTDASILQCQLMHDIAAVYVRNKDKNYIRFPDIIIELPMITGGEAFYKKLKGTVKGLGLLQHFLTYPVFFKFFLIKNLKPFLISGGTSIELVIMFKRREPSLVASIKPAVLKLNCVPVVNLFTKRSDRITIDRENYQFHLVPDRTAMRDYEVLSIHRLEFFNERNKTLFFAHNFYDENIENNKSNFFSHNRRKTLFDPKAMQRSSYSGTEVFVSFSAQSPELEQAHQFAADLICTNRDLPLLLLPDTALSSHTPLVQKASFVGFPSRPDYPLVERGNVSDFAKLSHIIFNLSSMLWQDGIIPLQMLKNLLRNYRSPSGEIEEMVEGIIKLESEQVSFRFIKKGTVFFEYGWKVTITLDELAYTGTGYYIFARVIGELLKFFAPINVLLEIHFYTLQSGRVAVWKTLEN